MNEAEKTKAENRLKRKFDEESGLSKNIPLPNIVRIEILNAAARNRYLGSIGKISNNFRDAASKNFRDAGLSRFFGFMKGNPKTAITLTATWQNSGGSAGGLLGSVGGLAKSLGGIVVGDSAGAIGQAFSKIADVGQDLTGLSASATGGSSLKRYNGGSLKGFTLSCGWYMPEQHDVCLKSLKSIMHMVYPVQASVTADKLSVLKDGVANAATAAENPGNVSAVTPPKTSFLADSISTLSEATFKLTGTNLTFDPLPVRVSVGQYMDIEPLVITEVSTEFSGETFINESGRHLPIFCSVNISFDFWMMPGPNYEFMSLLGNEMFGE